VVESDLNCVTRWSPFDNLWGGVSVPEILSSVKLRPDSVTVMAQAEPRCTTSISLADQRQEDVFLGTELTAEHRGPCRLVVPRLYFLKSAKRVRAFEFLDLDAPGYREMNGYHLRADPWREERYSDQETYAMQWMRAEAARRLRGR